MGSKNLQSTCLQPRIIDVHENLKFACPSFCFGALLSVWTTVVNFKNALDLPTMSMEFLDIIISNEKHSIYPMLRELHVKLLSALLLDRRISTTQSQPLLNTSAPSVAAKTKSRLSTANTVSASAEDVFEKSSFRINVSGNEEDPQHIEGVKPGLGFRDAVKPGLGFRDTDKDAEKSITFAA
jgi:hypothetical protein